MTDPSANIQVWFLRHGKTAFDYETTEYDAFMDMLCNGHETPLQEDHGINFAILPPHAELVAYSPAKRTVNTAQLLGKELGVEHMEELRLLREVQFDRNVLYRHEFKSLAANRDDILRRWYSDKNEKEKFAESWERVRNIESFLRERQEETIILVTHGWFLRLLEIYFVHGNHHTPSIEELLDVQPVPLGQCIKATIARKPGVESPSDSVGTERLNNPQKTHTGRVERYRTPATSLPNRR